MPIIPTPASGKQITDYTAGVFDGASLLYQSKGGTGYKVSGDDVANYVTATKVYPSIGNKSLLEGIGKELTGTLTAGSTTITLSDASITADSWVKPYASVWGVMCTDMVVSAGSVVLTFEAQSSDITVGVEVR